MPMTTSGKQIEKLREAARQARNEYLEPSDPKTVLAGVVAEAKRSAERGIYAAVHLFRIPRSVDENTFCDDVKSVLVAEGFTAEVTYMDDDFAQEFPGTEGLGEALVTFDPRVV